MLRMCRKEFGVIQSSPQVRIMQNGTAWYWEVITQDGEVLARGIADTQAQARADADKATRSDDRPWQA